MLIYQIDVSFKMDYYESLPKVTDYVAYRKHLFVEY